MPYKDKDARNRHLAEYRAKHREKLREYRRRYYAENKDRFAEYRQRAEAKPDFKERRTAVERRRHVKRTYNLSPEQYEQLIRSQHGLCAVCDTKPRGQFHVDHDHDTGEVRGLLCGTCNQGLGQFKDDVNRLGGAIRYLENFYRLRLVDAA